MKFRCFECNAFLPENLLDSNNLQFWKVILKTLHSVMVRASSLYCAVVLFIKGKTVLGWCCGFILVVGARIAEAKGTLCTVQLRIPFGQEELGNRHAPVAINNNFKSRSGSKFSCICCVSTFLSSTQFFFGHGSVLWINVVYCTCIYCLAVLLSQKQ